MHVLLTGASGFIGRHVCARLLAGGHGVTAAVRDAGAMARRFPGAGAVRIDMNHMRAPADWLPLLSDVDAVVARLGDLIGAGPITTTALVQLQYGNVADPAAFADAIGFRPRAMAAAFRDAPSHVQDRWHARLYFFRPVLTAALAVLWLGSGIAGLFAASTQVAAFADTLGIGPAFARTVAMAFSLVDLVIGGMLAVGQGGCSAWHNCC
jgi:NAD(P)-dependent dehydrogenase (short-subunit alcohol dehydrogenase family)